MVSGFPRIGDLRRALRDQLASELPDWTVWDGVQEGVIKIPALIIMESDTVLREGHDRPPFFMWNTQIAIYVVGGPEGSPRSWAALPDLMDQAAQAVQNAAASIIRGAITEMRIRIPGETIPIAGSNYHLGIITIGLIHSL